MLIIDMTMPRTCAECPICQFDNECGDLYHRCGETLNLCERPYEDRNEDCPIKGVLPNEHGDLIDRDKLKRAFCNHCDGDEPCSEPCVDIGLIETAPTVIAAERKDDGTTAD